MDMPNSVASSRLPSDQVDVRFIPPLSEQRQWFLLDILRYQPATSVLDLGCGEGTLLSAICRPSFALPPSPDFDRRYGIKEVTSIKSPGDLYPSWNVDRVAGLDLLDECLRIADEGVRPINGETSLLWYRNNSDSYARKMTRDTHGILLLDPDFRV